MIYAALILLAVLVGVALYRLDRRSRRFDIKWGGSA